MGRKDYKKHEFKNSTTNDEFKKYKKNKTIAS